MVKETSILKIVHFSNFIWNIKNIDISNDSYKFDSKTIGSLITRIKEPLLVKNDDIYKRITIKTKGQGIVVRDELNGNLITTKKQFYVHRGQFAISKIDARNGAFGIIPKEAENAIVTENFWVFNLKENILIDYLLLILSSDFFTKKWQIISNGSGNRLYLDNALFQKTLIPVPAIPEQKLIIQKYHKTIAQAEKFEKQADVVFCESHSYFDKILEIEDIRPNLKSGLNFIQYKNIDFWGVDKNACRKTIRNKKYKTVPLETLCSVGSGGTPSRNHPEYYKEGNIPWVKTTEVIDEIIYDTEEKITKKGLNNSSAKLYEPNSLIIAMYGQGQTRGRTAKLAIQATTNQACAVLHDIDINQVDIDYLWFYFQNEYERIRELASGNNQPNLNAGMIKTYPIVLPPLPIQEEIVNHINEIKAQIKELRRQALELREQAKKDFEGSVFE